MELNELSERLYLSYTNAVPGEKVTRVLLFGIENRDAILKYDVKEIIKKAGIPSNYSSEISKAVN